MSTPGYDRLKKFRARQRLGRGVVSIEIDLGAVGDLLVAAEFLPERDIDDRNKLSKALEAALDYWSHA
jgi:hypothetical protein